MEIWLIQNGEKTGPIHDFEVRKKIEAGELQPDTPAWHEGLPAWKPLVQISLFEREFERRVESRDTPGPPDLTEPPAGSATPSATASTFVIRRFWARWFDLYLYAGIWWFAMWASGRDIGAIISNSWIILLHYAPWFALESFLLHRFGTTPGKWLLGLRVSNNDGSLLSLSDATRRSARVLFIGLGFGWGVLSLICQLMAYFTTKRLGRPLWDYSGGHQLTAEPLHPMRLVAYVFALFAALQLQAIVIYPYVLEEMEKRFPDYKEEIEKNQPWHLPVRSTSPE